MYFYSVSEELLFAFTIATAAELSRVVFRGWKTLLGKAGNTLVRVELLTGESISRRRNKWVSLVFIDRVSVRASVQSSGCL